LNPTKKDIDDTYNNFLLEDAKTTKPEGVYSQYFIYYSGHGRMANNKTMAIDLENNDIEIEDYVYNIGVRRNCTVIAYFDCCREIVYPKCYEEEKKIKDQSICNRNLKKNTLVKKGKKNN
jgi:hypothetical protein